MNNQELLAAEKAAKHAARVARAAKKHVKAMRAVYRTAAMLEWEKGAPAREAQQEAFEDAFTRYRIEREWETVKAVAAPTTDTTAPVSPRPSRPPREAGGSMM